MGFVKGLIKNYLVLHLLFSNRKKDRSLLESIRDIYIGEKKAIIQQFQIEQKIGLPLYFRIFCQSCFHAHYFFLFMINLFFPLYW